MTLNLRRYFETFDPGSSHHLAGVSQLQEAMPAELLSKGAAWAETFDAPKPTPPNVFQILGPLLEIIRDGEGGYDSVNRGQAGDTPDGFPGLSNLTLGEVRDLQEKGDIFTAGAYQFIPSTLPLAMKAAGITDEDRFSPEVQDWLGVALILGGKRPRLADFLTGGKTTLDQGQDDLAFEWASIPGADGRGKYDGDGAGNRASAKAGKVRAALSKARDGLAGRGLPELKKPGKTAPVKGKPTPWKVAGLIGPKKTPHEFGFKAGDSHVVVNDASETARAYGFDGAILWEVPALGRGQGGDRVFQEYGTDTPPGLYKVGQVWNDWETAGGAAATFSEDRRSYGWLTFDLVELEEQERRLSRAGIAVHGGGKLAGWPGAWAARQPLYPTLGCVRMHNVDLRDRFLPLVKQGTVFVSVYQEG